MLLKLLTGWLAWVSSVSAGCTTLYNNNDNETKTCDAQYYRHKSTGPTPRGAATDGYVADALRASWLFYEAQRSGKLIENRVQWRKDSFLLDVSPSGQCLVGGHFDAGDNVYFGFPYAWTASTLAYSLAVFSDGYDKAGTLAISHNTVREMADFIAACYVSDDEIVVGLGDPNSDHSRWTRPEDVKEPRAPYVVTRTAPGTDVVAGMSAALSAAAYVLRKSDPVYAHSLAAKSKKLYEHAKKYRGIYSDSVPVASNFYKSAGYYDELAWAATWLALLTGNNAYRDEARSFLKQCIDTNGAPWVLPSWNDAYHFTIQILSRKADPSLRTNVTAITDAWMSGSGGVQYTPNGLAWGFQWGSLRYTANAAFYALASVKDLPSNDPYRKKVYCWAKGQLDYILGKSSKNSRSFVVGVGNNPPCRPHHRAASCPAGSASCDWNDYNADACNPNVIVGALVGGPGSDDSYVDDRKDFMKNEVALDYNAGFTGALAGLLQLSDGSEC